MGGRPDQAVVEAIASGVRELFPFVEVRLWVPLKELFGEPKGKGLARFRMAPSHADLALFHKGRCVAIIEPGGGQHADDPKQRLRDKKKDQLCWINQVNVVRCFNSELTNLKSRAWRKMIRAAIFSRPAPPQKNTNPN